MTELVPSTFNEAQVSLLQRKTPLGHVFRRQGPGGIVLSYVKTYYVVDSLNQLCGHNWSYVTVWHEVGENEVIVQGRLTLQGKDGATMVKDGFGSAPIKRDKRSGLPLSVGDDLKAAASDALKKAASYVGIAIDIYSAGEIATEGGVTVIESLAGAQATVPSDGSVPTESPLSPLHGGEAPQNLLQFIAAFRKLGLTREEVQRRLGVDTLTGLDYAQAWAKIKEE